MKKIGLILFLAVFVLMCLWPFAGMLLFGPSEAAANEVLAQPPTLRTQEGGLNLRYLNDLGDYFADHFAARQEMITANAVLEALIFKESASPKVILGTDGWLYYETTLDDYQGKNQLTDRELWAAAHSLSLIQEYAEANGIRFLFTVVPNKNTLYPEHMPPAYFRSTAPGNLERLSQALEEAGVSYLDLYGKLAAQEAVLYQKLDSHWNNLGAALAHDAIMEALGLKSEQSYLPARFTAAATHDADLYRMLYPTGTQKDVQLMPDWEWRFTYDRPIRSPEDQTIYTSSEGQTGALLMFRDSFGNTLHPFMAESFGSACFSRAMPYQLSMIEQEHPDTLVIEIVQRNIAWLAQRAPVMPAPLRELSLPQSTVEQAVSCTRTQTGEKQFCYTGNIHTPLDTHSPIYLLCEGSVYEASPAGEGEGAFTAYLPLQADSIQVLFEQNGQLVKSQQINCEG